MDETERRKFEARGQTLEAPRRRPTIQAGTGARVSVTGTLRHEALRSQGAMGYRIDGDEGPHAFADQMERAPVEMAVGEGREVGPPFARVEEMSAPAVVGVVALATQIKSPDGEAFVGHPAPERTEVRRRAAQAVDAEDVGPGFGLRFPHQARKTFAVVPVPFEVPRPADHVFIGGGGGHATVIFHAAAPNGKRRIALAGSAGRANVTG